MITEMTRDVSSFSDRVYMAELEKKLKRNRSTIRVWEDRKWLPDELMPHRDEHDWRYWTPEQVKKIKKWMKSRNKGRSQPGARGAT